MTHCTQKITQMFFQGATNVEFNRNDKGEFFLSLCNDFGEEITLSKQDFEKVQEDFSKFIENFKEDNNE